MFAILSVLSAIYVTFAEDTVILNEETISEKPIRQMTDGRQISADHLKWEYEAGIAVFTGNVIMKGNEGEIRCLKMTAIFNKEDEIEKIVAEENATLTRENQKGGAEIIEIYPDKNLIILKQEAWISSDKATFQGEEIIFDTEKEIINITKGVRGQIQAGSDNEIENEATDTRY
jgi:lipopolysaccharide transport protein LptA